MNRLLPLHILNLRKSCVLCLLLALSTFAPAQNSVKLNAANEIQRFELKDVRLLESPFKKAQETDLSYIMSLNPDRLLAPFLREAGLTPKAESYGNWENTGLDGHIGGHYLSALSMMYAATGNQKVLERLNYMVDELKKCQDKNGNGYVAGIPGGKAMWEEVAGGKIDAGSFSLNKKWVPWYNIHKLYAGLRDAYLFAGNRHAKEMLVKLSDWALNLVSGLTDDQVQNMLTAEHGGMNEVFADVADITGDKKYLELARRFSHQVILQPLLEKQDKLNGIHANTQIPKVIGYERIAEVAGDTAWEGAARFFWETVVNNRTSVIGGNSVREHFHPASDFTPMITDPQGPETCNTYNMLRLSGMLYQWRSDLKFIDYYERAVFNHILSTQHPDRGGFVYFTPMRPRHYRVYSQPQLSFWCCVGSGMENHTKYGELIYAHTGNDLLVNLFIPSEVKWKEKGLTLTQHTRFPESEKTVFSITSKSPSRFALKIRYPAWVAPGALKVWVNNREQYVNAGPGSYVSISRVWNPGDRVVVALPMKTVVEPLPSKPGYLAVLHGPIVLAAKTDTTDMPGLFSDDSRMGHVAQGKLYPLQDAPLLVSDKAGLVSKIKPVPGKPLTFAAPELMYPDKYKNLELIPFYRLHDARYVIYFQQTNRQGLRKIQQANIAMEQARLKLEERTVDQVAPGEQQPESDHFFRDDRSESGIHQDRHFRQAKGWFSYKLRDKDKNAGILQITYYGMDKGRSFDILVNDTKIAPVNLDGGRGDAFYTVDYPIPAEVVQKAANNILETKFAARGGSMTGRIFYVRLLRK